jgi:hypothetical protein
LEEAVVVALLIVTPTDQKDQIQDFQLSLQQVVEAVVLKVQEVEALEVLVEALEVLILMVQELVLVIHPQQVLLKEITEEIIVGFRKPEQVVGQLEEQVHQIQELQEVLVHQV